MSELLERGHMESFSETENLKILSYPQDAQYILITLQVGNEFSMIMVIKKLIRIFKKVELLSHSRHDSPILSVSFSLYLII